MYDISTEAKRAELIHKLNTGIYTFEEDDCIFCILRITRDEGMSITRNKKSKPFWLEITNYDVDGVLEETLYEPA